MITADRRIDLTGQEAVERGGIGENDTHSVTWLRNYHLR
jgi:hypothetical protein